MKSAKLLICLAIAALTVGVLAATVYAAHPGPDIEPLGPEVYDWIKYVNDTPWTPGMSITVQTSDTIKIEEIVTASEGFAVDEFYDPEHLHLLNWTATCGTWTYVTYGHVRWTVISSMPVYCTLTKWFHVEPCTWTGTTLLERLSMSGIGSEEREVLIQKVPPQLWIDAAYEPGVLSGFPADLALSFGNNGGYENDVMIRNEFPATALFDSSVPPPDRVDPDRRWVEWDTGDLPMGAQGEITVTVAIQPGLPVSTTIEIWDGIFGHTGGLLDAVTTTFHVDPPFEWTKLIDGVLWTPGMSITVQTSDTIQIVETIASPLDYGLYEYWDTARLHLLDWAATGGVVTLGSGQMEWDVAAGSPPATLTKRFHIEPSTWTETLLNEVLVVDSLAPVARAVAIHKLPPLLWIDATYQPSVYAGRPANFRLNLGNAGGYENDVWIRNDFPATALFDSAVPPPTNADPERRWAEWYIVGLPQGSQAHIDVTVMIQPGLPPSTAVEIWDGILDHTGALRDWVLITLHIPYRVYLPVIYRNFGYTP